MRVKLRPISYKPLSDGVYVNLNNTTLRLFKAGYSNVLPYTGAYSSHGVLYIVPGTDYYIVVTSEYVVKYNIEGRVEWVRRHPISNFDNVWSYTKTFPYSYYTYYSRRKDAFELLLVNLETGEVSHVLDCVDECNAYAIWNDDLVYQDYEDDKYVLKTLSGGKSAVIDDFPTFVASFVGGDLDDHLIVSTYSGSVYIFDNNLNTVFHRSVYPDYYYSMVPITYKYSDYIMLSLYISWSNAPCAFFRIEKLRSGEILHEINDLTLQTHANDAIQAWPDINDYITFCRNGYSHVVYSFAHDFRKRYSYTSLTLEVKMKGDCCVYYQQSNMRYIV